MLLVAASALQDNEHEARATRLRTAGAELINLPGAKGQVDLPALLAHLAQRGVNELHVEAGAQLNGALARTGLVDEWLVYVAPRLLGTGRGVLAGPPLVDLAQSLDLRHGACEPVGDDLRLRLFQRQGFNRV